MEDVVFFEGDGDFRSEESLKLLKTSDIVITNPPFSLLKEYIPKSIEYNKDFLIIAGISTISIKNIFELIKENKIWFK